jgi:hypothetical protein
MIEQTSFPGPQVIPTGQDGALEGQKQPGVAVCLGLECTGHVVICVLLLPFKSHAWDGFLSRSPGSYL